MGLFASICWQIWKARNAWVFRNEWVDETRVIAIALEEFHEFCQANQSTVQAISRGNEASDQRWIPPDGNVLKINVDGAFDPRTYKGGVGLVIRDDQGNIRRAIAAPIQNTRSAEMVEALGFRMAVCTAKECTEVGYIVVGDAQGVINMLQEKTVPKANLEVIIRDSIVFSSSLNSVSFQYVPRFCNRVAHRIAKYALSLDSTRNWLGDIPSWIQMEASLDRFSG